MTAGVGLLRHPPVRSVPGRCYGRADLPLADGWQASLPSLAASLRRLAPMLIRTSPLGRCLLPARALGRLLDIPVERDPRLIELDFGRWEGLDWDQVPRAALDRWARDPLGFAPPGGETGNALIERTAAVRAELAADRRSCLVVSHGGPLRLLGPMLRGEAPDLLAAPPPMGVLQIHTLETGPADA